MLRKFLKISSVGRFHSYETGGDIEFRKINLVFAENGSGKTTLASILRSFHEQDATYLTERATIGATEAQAVSILLKGQTAKFTNNQWDCTSPPLIIFDSHFVNRNVFTGTSVDSQTRKELYSFVIGDEQVSLFRRIEEIDKEIRETNTKITAQNKTVETHASGMGVLDFRKVRPVSDIEQQIVAANNKLKTQQDAQRILDYPVLQTITFPEFDFAEMEAILKSGLDDIVNDAEQLVNEHVRAHLDHHGETWLRDGYSYLANSNACPFCGQLTSASALVTTYKTYFSEEYKRFLESIRDYQRKMQSLFRESVTSSASQTFVSNSERGKFWREYVGISLPESPEAKIRQAWETLRSEVFSSIQRKLEDPLQCVEICDELSKAAEKYQHSLSKITDYNNSINDINKKISAEKERLAAGSTSQLQQELSNLQRIQTRFRPEVSGLCDELSRLESHKKQLEQEKKDVRKRLTDSESTLLSQYQSKLNHYLLKFGTDFSIEEYQTVHTGGTPRSNFRLHVNEESVDIGDSNTFGKPCFRTLLSEGDKSTLAFAFFMAKLDTTDLSNTIVVIDDPITSLDFHRRSCSQSVLATLHARVKQLIVLSHDDLFLREIFEHGSVPNAETRLLYIRKTGEQSEIKEWNLNQITSNRYLKDCRTIQAYIETGSDNELDVVRSLRPVLENNLRMRFPNIFPQDKWLGDFINMIRIANPGDPLHEMKLVYNVLSEINDYTAPFHHADGGGGTMPSSTELKSYARRTLRFIQGLPNTTLY